MEKLNKEAVLSYSFFVLNNLKTVTKKNIFSNLRGNLSTWVLHHLEEHLVGNTERGVNQYFFSIVVFTS